MTKTVVATATVTVTAAGMEIRSNAAGVTENQGIEKRGALRSRKRQDRYQTLP